MTESRKGSLFGEILILGAGASRRMRGTDKLLEPVDDIPQLRRIAGFALQTEWPVLVTLKRGEGPRAATLSGLDVSLVPVPRASEGIAASLRAGLSAHASRAALANRPAGGLMILPADMPELATKDLNAVIRAHIAAPHLIHCGASGDRRGHPVILPVHLFPAVAQLRGDRGANGIIQDNQGDIRLTALPEKRAVLDLDTPEAWAAWREIP